MKTKYIFIGIALACVLGACSRDEESLFDKNASERAQEALDNANEVLVAPEFGWEMIYFANPDSKGYNIIMKFDKDGRVTATAKNATTTHNRIITDSVSTWLVKLDYGPIISFDTYNDVLHAWAEPGTDGDGLLGDYEFLILHADSSYVKLKGKKHSAYCYLYPFKPNSTAEEYYTSVEALQKRLSSNGNIFHVKANTEEYLLHYDASTGLYNLTLPNNAPNSEELESYPVAFQENGIQFMVSPRALGDVRFDIKDGQLVSNSSELVTAPLPDYFIEQMQLAKGSWTIDITKHVNDSLKQAVDSVTEALKEAYPKNKKKAGVQSLRFKKTNDVLALVINYIGNSAKIDIAFTFNIQIQNGGVKLTYVEPTTDAAANVLTYFPTIAGILKQVEGHFTITTSDVLNPTLGLYMIDSSNSEKWFDMTGKTE